MKPISKGQETRMRILRETAPLLNKRGFLSTPLAEGVASGEIRPDVHPDEAATWIIASTEGGLMLSNLYKDPVYLNRSLDQILSHIDSDLKLRG